MPGAHCAHVIMTVEPPAYAEPRLSGRDSVVGPGGRPCAGRPRCANRPTPPPGVGTF